MCSLAKDVEAVKPAQNSQRNSALSQSGSICLGPDSIFESTDRYTVSAEYPISGTIPRRNILISENSARHSNARLPNKRKSA